MTSRALIPLIVALAIVALPEAASACAVCFSGSEESRGAYLGTTIFLSLLPLGVIAGILYYLWRRARALAAEEEPPLPAE